MQGYCWTPYFVEGDDPMRMHQQMAFALDEVIGHLGVIHRRCQENRYTDRPHWPMIVLRSPKGPGRLGVSTPGGANGHLTYCGHKMDRQ